jgi:hypothetical protein
LSTSVANLVAEMKALQDSNVFQSSVGGITENLITHCAQPMNMDADPGAHKLQDKPVV